MRHAIIGNPHGLPIQIKKNARMLLRTLWLKKIQFPLSCALVILLQFFANQASAQTAIPGAVLTCTQSTTSTSSCVGSGGKYANGWTGSGKYWQYEISTLGYTNIVFNTPTSSSGTGPHTGTLVYSTNGTSFTFVQNYNWSGTGCTSTGNISLPSGADNQATLYVRLIMTGATSSGGTNRVNPDAFTGTPSGCTGAPTGGSISAGQTTFCGYGSTTLTLSGASGGSGITYQWQESPNGTSGWANITSATSSTYDVDSLDTTNFYRVEVTCTNSAQTSYSSVQQLTINTLPTVGSITSLPTNDPMLVGDMADLDNATAGGVWSSSNPSVISIDANTGEITADYGGTSIIEYTVTDFGTFCTNSASVTLDVVWPNTLALYAGHDGTSTDVITVDSVAAGALTANGFGNATPCGSGGLSGLTVPFADSIFSTGGPYVSYKIYPDPTPGAALNVFQIHARARVSGSGPAFARLAYRVGNGSWVVDDSVALQSGSCGASANSWYYTLGGPTITGITDSFEVAVFPYKPASGSGVFQLNSLEVYGQVSTDANCTTLGGSIEHGTIQALYNTNICDSGYRTLELVHNGGVGISYQWQESSNGTSWSNVSGATGVYYTTPTLYTDNYYRVEVSCSGGSTVYSDTLQITVTATPTISITNPRSVIAVGSAWDFDGTAPITGDTIRWTSNYISTFDADSATGAATAQFPAKDVHVTYLLKRSGCTAVARDTFDIVDSSAIAYYLGDNGSSTSTVALQNVSVTALANNGLGSGTACSKGGLSGLNNAPSTFSTSNGYVSFKTAANSLDVVAITGIRATLRRSASGPAYARLAYRVYSSGAWGNWIDEGQDQEVPEDDCGYSPGDIYWGGVSTPVPSFAYLLSSIYDSVEVAVFPFDASSASGTFQVNSLTLIGHVREWCQNAIDIQDASNMSVQGQTLTATAHSLHVSGTTPSNTYWGILDGANDPAYGYFNYSNITAGNNTGTLNVVSCYPQATIFAIADRGTCLDFAEDEVNFVCSPKPTSVSNTENASFVKFYPNPANATVNVVANNKVNIAILGMDGKLLIQQTNAKSINISNLANGIYIIKAYDDQNNTLKTEKLIKQ